MSEMFTYAVPKCSKIPDGPQYVGLLLHGMNTVPLEEGNTFIDRIGQIVKIPRKDTGNKTSPYADDGYAKALWDYRNGSLMLGEDEKTLYVRDVDRTGNNQLLDTWHAISNLENEYHVKSAKAYYPWNRQLQVECAKLTTRVRHGIKFTNLAYIRTQEGVRRIPSNDEYFNQPFEVTFDQPFDTTLAAQAVSYMTDVTIDMHSAKNLGRMFATPLLEPYKHLTYIMYGDGGNGKGILLGELSRSFPDTAVAVDSQIILGGKRGSGGFEKQQETGKLIGALWAYDQDADAIGLDQLTYLKKISTGDIVTARRIGENAVSFIPKCTFVIATNNPIVTTMTAASARRFAYIRMKDGRKPEDFQPLLDFRNRHGVAPFMMASCKIWENYGDDPFTDVSVGSPDDTTDLEQDIINDICIDGYAPSNMLSDMKRYEQRDLLARLGLQRAGSIWIPELGKTQRVLTVKDEIRFAPYRTAYEHDREQLEEQLHGQLPAKPQPIEADPLPLPGEFAFNCAYVPASPDKVARNWKQLTMNPNYDSTQRPQGDVYAVVPRLGYAIIDMDMPKDDSADGWTILNQQIGAYGSDAFPGTYLVGTPSGGVHAYYALPGQLIGQLKNMVHSHGIPVDIRCELKGYVIGPGSRTAKGNYTLLDMPKNDVPMMPPKMVEWLQTNGYVEGIDPQPILSAPSIPKPLPTVDELLRDTSREGTNNGQPDMDPIPEGQRNTTLFNQLLGRRIHHPENETNIRNEFYERGHVSGLGDQELTTIWNSVTTIINQK